ncbi:hypothetical protein LguiB_003061 [Lonicera macranthoides]
MMHNKSSTSTSLEKMMAKTPVEIGTRGIVGSLVLREIEYFSQLELGYETNSNKPRCQHKDMATTSSNSRPKLRSLITTPRRKKKGSNKLIQECVLWWKLQRGLVSQI